ncbi:MAG: hypothetical protein AVDCRST_MAG04-1873, partial [uncultured Acetobacteraceae bacterium]
ERNDAPAHGPPPPHGGFGGRARQPPPGRLAPPLPSPCDHHRLAAVPVRRAEAV